MINKPLKMALVFAAKGWKIFPQDRNKRPCIKDWPNQASDDPEQIRTWGKQFPKANFAVVTGKRSGIIVLDVDVKNDLPGKESFLKLEKHFGKLPGMRSRTPSGGGHVYFTYPERNGEIRNSSELQGFPGIEVKGNGGCVTLPGSLYANGREYVLISDKGAAECPQGLLKLLISSRYQHDNRHNKQQISPDQTIQSGGRNNRLTALAGAMRRQGADQETILTALIAENENHCSPPLPREEVKSIAQSVARYEPADMDNVEIDFFRSLSHGSGADVLQLHLKDYLFEPYDRRGNGDFYFKKPGECYYQKVQNPKATAREVLEKSINRSFGCLKQNISSKDVKEVYSQMGNALKKCRTRDFLNGVLALYAEGVILDPIPRNETPEALPCLDKVIDFSEKTPSIRDPNPGEYFFDPIPYKAEEILSAKETLKYDHFLEQLFPDPETLVTARYCLSLAISNKGSKYFTIWYGPLGNNAKNTIMDLIIKVLGDRAVSLKGALILRNADKSERRFGEIELRGKTVGFFDEVGGHFNIAQIKRLTSLSYIRGENKGEKSVQFLQTWSLNALCNKLPTFYPADDLAFLSRLLVLPFESVFYASAEDKEKYSNRGVTAENLHPARDKNELMAELGEEKAGIIRYLIYDFIDLRESYNGKILESHTCKALKEKYRHDNDLIERFFDDSLTHSEDEFVSSQKLLELYQGFSGDKKITARRLVDLLIERFPFICRDRVATSRGIKGVAVKNDSCL